MVRYRSEHHRQTVGKVVVWNRGGSVEESRGGSVEESRGGSGRE